MAPTVGPSYLMQKHLVKLLTEDEELQELLFPVWAPQEAPEDKRIYGISPSINDRKIVDSLPRIIVETEQNSANWEQPDPSDSGPIHVYMHVFVPADHYNQGELIDWRIRTLIGSTNFSGADIIAAELIQTGARRRMVQSAFLDAWHIMTPYISRNVGVL